MSGPFYSNQSGFLLIYQPADLSLFDWEICKRETGFKRETLIRKRLFSGTDTELMYIRQFEPL